MLYCQPSSCVPAQRYEHVHCEDVNQISPKIRPEIAAVLLLHHQPGMSCQQRSRLTCPDMRCGAWTAMITVHSSAAAALPADAAGSAAANAYKRLKLSGASTASRVCRHGAPKAIAT